MNAENAESQLIRSTESRMRERPNRLAGADALDAGRDVQAGAELAPDAGETIGSAARSDGPSVWYRIGQRALDLVVSIVVLPVAGPLMLVIAALVKLDSPGPVLFRHQRIGRDRRNPSPRPYAGSDRRSRDLFGQPFVLYKFRTMYRDARTRFPHLYTYQYTPEELTSLPIKVLVGSKQLPKGTNGHASTVDAAVDDPRITRVGTWLRMSSLDELPNFLNVLRGDMHLVGPRPDIYENIRYYPPSHREKLRVRPGITGLAQIRGRGTLSFLQTNQYDVEYVRNRSLVGDLRIILQTIWVTVRGDGAF